MNKFKDSFYKRKFLILFLIFSLFIGGIVYPIKTNAGGDFIGGPTNLVRGITDYIRDDLLNQLKKIGSLTFQSTLQTALNTLALDAATWIGSGGPGQTPLFSSEYLEDFGNKALDSATSQFIQSLSKEWAVDLCKPSFNVQASIGLGLVQFNRAEFTQVDCGWQELTQNWTNEYEKWKSIYDDPGGFLKKVGTMFDPASNDIGTSLTLYTRIDEEGRTEKKKVEEQLKINQGWLDIRNIGGSSETPPGQAQRELQKADASQVQNLGKFTGDAIVDAINIFTNQLALSAFNKYIRGGGLVDFFTKKDSDNSNADLGFTSPESDPKSFFSQNYMVDSLKKVIKPRFDVKADFNILSDLVICLDKDNPMPNNCVIDNKFSQAIQNRYTVIGAIENGFVNSNWVFDRNIDYLSGFNYRSLIILRKFRIIPIGWEEALIRAEEQTAIKGYRYTLMDMISCFDPKDDYNTFSDGFIKSNFSNHTWCEGLIDPAWVLKAPLNYCKRQGFGGYLTSKQLIEIPDNISSSSTGVNIDIDPIVISRADNYCADEQSCIKERFDGTCEYYGYCTEEKRIWNFGQDSCNPVYNTCDSFTSASNGKKLALLKNTIDYGSCDSDNIGCSSYAVSGVYSTSTKKISWNIFNPTYIKNIFNLIYLNGKTETCSAVDEGCQEFIKTASGSGHNFLLNGSFEEDLSIGDWKGKIATSSNSYSGNVSAFLAGGDSLNKSVPVVFNNHVIAGESYTLSFYSYCQSTSTVAIASKNKNILPSDNFTYQIVNYTFPSNYSSNIVNFSITSDDGGCYIDNIKLERGTVGTYYSDYRDNGLVYQKLIPNYLENICYENPLAANPDFRLKEDAPSECYNYARLCNLDEIGCNLFTSTYGIQTSAKALEKDYCPGQCVGYDVYVQNNTLFEEKNIEKIIPSTAMSCSANYAGCTEFTNLDEVAAGGEGKEYYVNLRHCIKPTQGNCDNFYSWEGSNESGYQLKSFRLEKVTGTTGIIPKLTKGSFSSSVDNSGNTVYSHSVDGVVACSQAIYNLPISNPSHNPDCREFYNQDGDVIYALRSTSITCSEDCKPYRMTEKNINSSITNLNDCKNLNSGGVVVSSWDSNLNVCYHCLAGGKWDSTQESCVYQAIPGEGKVCSVNNNNCREYNGNSGNNIRIVSSYDFNLGIEPWIGSGVASSTEALNQGGRSMSLTGEAEVEVGNLVSEGSSYVIKFSAKSNQSRDLAVSFVNNSGANSLFGIIGENQNNPNSSITIPANSEWQTYQVSLDYLDHNVDSNEKLSFNNLGPVAGSIYITNIVLLEVVDKYYLIKDSWNTPEICYYDIMNNYRGVNYNLGCQPYTDLTNLNHNLRQFSKLCSDSAVGCQIMVQTNNYSSPDSDIFNDDNDNGVCDSDETHCVSVPADKFVAMVYDSNKSCSSANMGCSRLGKIISTNPYAVSQNIYQDVYLRNNPNNYNNILCLENEVGCDAWSSNSGSGTLYFKDPGDNLCQWRKGSDINSNFAWYKKAVKKCKSGSSFTNNICSSENDCLSGQTCELDTSDYLCPVDSMKTIGYGGINPVYQPGESFDIKWTGLCPLKDSGCTEYIDPLSSFNSNIILNSYFSDLDGDESYFDLWENISTTPNACTISPEGVPVCTSLSSPGTTVPYKFIQKKINIEPNKLYILQTNGYQVAKLKCEKPVFILNKDNILEDSGVYDIVVEAGLGYKKIFYSGENNFSCDIEYDTESSDSAFNILSPDNDFSIEVREAVVDYQLKQNLDFSSCNGQADFNNSCIVFNERSYNGPSGYADLGFTSSDYSNYSICNGSDCDSNALIKVNPDRICGKWLSCYVYNYNPYTNEKICLEMGECTAFNYDGSCFNFFKPLSGVREYSSANDLNASGYSILGIEHLANLKQVGEDFIEFNFESGSDLGGWFLGGANNNPSIEKCLINKSNSIGIKNSNVTYPASGVGFIKVGGSDCSGSGSEYYWISNTILGDFSENSNYYFSALVNTSDLNLSERAKIDIVDSADSNSSGGNLELSRKSDWQEISFKFTYKSNWKNGLKIILGVKNNNDDWSKSPIYFDDIRIEPVLEVKKSEKFIPATCRLYPTQDSLRCESENRNFISNGWYGYCLQKDPSNSDVCLLWYPIDSVKGRKGTSVSFSSFTGYPDTGSKPYYCAEMSADFDLVEKREAYVAGFWHSNEVDGKHYRCDGVRQLDPCECESDFSKYYFYAGSQTNNNLPNYPTNPLNYIISNHCIGSSCLPINLNNTTWQGCFGSNSSNGNDYVFTICKPDASFIIKERKTIADEDVTVYDGAGNSCTWWKTDEKQLFFDDSGWYKYNGTKGDRDALIKILAYDYSENECDIIGGEWKSAVINDPDGACLLELEDYSPKCTKIVQGEIPWAQRLKSSPYSVAEHEYYDPVGTDPDVSIALQKNLPLHYYNLSTPGAPFGAIVNSGAPLSDFSAVFAGVGSATLASSGKYYGLPYSCDSAGRTVFNNNSLQDSCAFIYFDNGVKVFDPANGNYNNISERNYWEMQTVQSFSFKDYLKQLFLKVVSIKGTSTDEYNYTANSTTNIPIIGQSNPRDHETDYVAVYPSISTTAPNEVRLTNAIGVPVNKNGDIYEVESAGFYTLSFNTIVDLEQVPLSEVIVRIKSTSTPWSSDGGFIKLNNIDPVPPESGGSHKVFRYLTPGNYNILIKAKDNWGFYNCVGLSGFVSDSDCLECCVENEFLDIQNVSSACDLCEGS